MRSWEWWFTPGRFRLAPADLLATLITVVVVGAFGVLDWFYATFLALLSLALRAFLNSRLARKAAADRPPDDA